MPISLADLTRKVRSVVVDYDGQQMTLAYLPGKFTPAAEARIAEAQRQGESATGLADEMVSTIVSWDLLEDDGKPVEITKETLRNLPTPFLVQCWIAMGQANRPNAQSAAT